MGQMYAAGDLRNIASRLHRAALKPNPLHNWSQVIADLLDTENADLTVFSAAGTAIQSGGTMLHDILGQEYLEYYQYINPFQTFWQRSAGGKAVRIGRDMIDDQLRRSEFYQRYSDYLDAGDAVCMQLKIRSARVLVHASKPRHRTDDDERHILELIGDDLLLSFEIAGALSHATNMVGNVIKSLDQKGIGAAVLDVDGKIESINGCMRQIIEAGSVLRSDQGRLIPGTQIHLPEFPELVRRTRKSGVGGRLCFNDPSSGRRGHVITYPAPTVFDWEDAEDNKVVLLVTDSAAASELLKDRLTKMYGLTRAEAGVVTLLVNGKPSQEIASKLSINSNTVRAHLKAAYSKTGTHSQVELLNLIRFEGDSLM